MFVANCIGRAVRAHLRCCLTTCQIVMASLLAVPPATAAEAAPMSFVMQSFPPFAFEQDGKIQGPFPELVLEVCKAMNTSCKLAVYPWRRALRLAESGAVDGILVVQKLSERENRFYLTEPVIRSSYGLYVPQDSSLHDFSPVQLPGYTVAAYGPSATSQAANDVLKSSAAADLVMEIDNLTVLRKLAAQRYGAKGAAVVNVDVANYLIKQDKLAQVRLIGEIRQIEYVIGLSKRSVTALQAERFGATLHRLMEDGTVKAIADKYEMRMVAPSSAGPLNQEANTGNKNGAFPASGCRVNRFEQRRQDCVHVR
jgi:polar amino acid transport system substrate-binding protein